MNQARRLSLQQSLFEKASLQCQAGRHNVGAALYALGWKLSAAEVNTNKVNDYALLHRPDIRTHLRKLTDERPVVFVTGCARSGTSLLHRCLSTLPEPVYYWSENSLAQLWREPPTKGKHIVLKRRALCRAFFHAIPKNVYIVHIVRDPMATLTSRVKGLDTPYVTPERWRAEYQAFCKLRKRHPAGRLVVVRYEDLIANPDQLQAQIASALGLTFEQPFSAYHTRDHLDMKIDKHTGQKRIWHPIEPERAKKHRQGLDDAPYLRGILPTLEPELSAFCREFGYEVPHT
jgi:hypothetical protein